MLENLINFLLFNFENIKHKEKVTHFTIYIYIHAFYLYKHMFCLVWKKGKVFHFFIIFSKTFFILNFAVILFVVGKDTHFNSKDTHFSLILTLIFLFLLFYYCFFLLLFVCFSLECHWLISLRCCSFWRNFNLICDSQWLADNVISLH